MVSPPESNTPEERTPEEEQKEVTPPPPVVEPAVEPAKEEETNINSNDDNDDVAPTVEPPVASAAPVAAVQAEDSNGATKFKSPLLQQMMGNKGGRLKLSSDKLSQLANEEEEEENESRAAEEPAAAVESDAAAVTADELSVNGARDTTGDIPANDVADSNTDSRVLITDRADEDKDVDTLEHRDSTLTQAQVAPPGEATGDLLGLSEPAAGVVTPGEEGGSEESRPVNGFSQKMDIADSPTVADTRYEHNFVIQCLVAAPF